MTRGLGAERSLEVEVRHRAEGEVEEEQPDVVIAGTVAISSHFESSPESTHKIVTVSSWNNVLSGEHTLALLFHTWKNQM